LLKRIKTKWQFYVELRLNSEPAVEFYNLILQLQWNCRFLSCLDVLLFQEAKHP